MATKLGVYNRALLHLGERKLASLTEARESRRRLDDCWEDAVVFALEQGYWNFALLTAQLQPSGSFTPQFGYRYAFDKPADWAKTYALTNSPDPNAPALRRFLDQAAYWLVDDPVLYARYVSKGAGLGLDPARWTQSFAEYIAARLARLAAPSTGSGSLTDTLAKVERKARADALSKDAMDEPPGQTMPTGTWVASRRRTGENG